MYPFDITYLLLIPAILLSIYAQIKVSSTFSRYQKISSQKNMTGYEAADLILKREGLSSIPINEQSGHLSDNYNPLKKELNLSSEVYRGNSLASIGVAAHEAGHAIQHARGYFPIKLRTGIYPIANIGTTLAWPLVFIGILLSLPVLLKVGIVFFTLAVFFTLITLPVEFNASKRALALLTENGIVTQEEVSGCKKVLNAAALTYVAAALTAVLELVRLLLIARSRE